MNIRNLSLSEMFKANSKSRILPFVVGVLFIVYSAYNFIWFINFEKRALNSTAITTGVGQGSNIFLRGSHPHVQFTYNGSEVSALALSRGHSTRFWKGEIDVPIPIIFDPTNPSIVFVEMDFHFIRNHISGWSLAFGFASIAWLLQLIYLGREKSEMILMLKDRNSKFNSILNRISELTSVKNLVKWMILLSVLMGILVWISMTSYQY